MLRYNLHWTNFLTHKQARFYGQLPPKRKPCPQMFWLQQQYAVYQGRFLAFKLRQNAFPAGPCWGSLRRSSGPLSRMGRGYPLAKLYPTRRFLHLNSRFSRLSRSHSFGTSIWGGHCPPKYFPLEPPLQADYTYYNQYLLDRSLRRIQVDIST